MELGVLKIQTNWVILRLTLLERHHRLVGHSRWKRKDYALLLRGELASTQGEAGQADAQ
jgi:hypothetical protein